MTTAVRQLSLLALAVALWVVACNRPDKASRCTHCGMSVTAEPRWIAGAESSSGVDKPFCSPRCLFAWMKGEKGQGARKPWVTEYDSQKRLDISDLFFVIGSDVLGPMGHALVPVAGRDAAERFLKDHGGHRILSTEEITPAVLENLGHRRH